MSADYDVTPQRSQPLLSIPCNPPLRRSLSVTPAISASRRGVARSGSTSAVPTMTAVTKAPGLPYTIIQNDEASLSTRPDPRSPDISPRFSTSGSSSPHPDLSSEIAMLSNKLISAINHQTTLDDMLAGTRQELASAQDRIRKLEVDNQEHARLVATGILVRKTEVDDESGKLAAKLAEEKKRRTVVENDKKSIEQELETLTTALFEEANEMVAAARKEREAAEKRAEQLRIQLNDTETLLASHQEQLAELKMVMQQMSTDRDDLDANTTASTTPSTPAVASHGDLTKIFDALRISPAALGVDDISPAPPTSFSHLLSPVLRTDLQSYEDFRSLLLVSRKSARGSRVSSGSYNGVNTLGLNTITTQSSHIPSNSSTSSLSTPATGSATPSTTPTTPAYTVSSISSPILPLKETRFYKRALAEDIEPTLRLDTAPGLSWLARRTVINSMSEGSLVVEPMPASTKTNVFSCSLCGEHRKGEEFLRTHRFRTSENENAQRYPLCSYCLNRVRASCDYLGFLRMVKDGHWRTDGMEAEKLAWEESVRLRERMFWARIGGGVVPAFIHTRESPRVSVEDPKPSKRSNVPSALNEKGSNNYDDDLSKEDDDPFRLTAKRASVDNSVTLRRERENWESARHAAIFDDVPPSPKKSLDPAANQLQSSLRDSLKSRQRPNLKADSLEKAYEPEVESLGSQNQESSVVPPMEKQKDGALAQSLNERRLKPELMTVEETEKVSFAQPPIEQGLSITIPGAFNF